jgi:superfamily II DNA helicase RecQ
MGPHLQAGLLEGMSTGHRIMFYNAHFMHPQVARFAKEIHAERIVALTATATPAVAKDICKGFGIAEAGLFRTTTYRSNLNLLARSFKTKKESFTELLAFLAQHPGPTIIYVTTKKQSEELAGKLRRNEIHARHFHSEVKNAAKEDVQNEFLTSDRLIVVATIAFGMGLDKPNLRNVIHYNIPKSLEGYSYVFSPLFKLMDLIIRALTFSIDKKSVEPDVTARRATA